METPFITRIISGGQTGADIGGLVAAERLGIATGGMAPKGYRTEKGPQPDILKNRFGLIESRSSGYEDRTRHNILSSDATVVLATKQTSPGTLLTLSLCEQSEKSCFMVDPFMQGAADEILTFLQLALIGKTQATINIAGNRESVSPGIAKQTAAVIWDAVTRLHAQMG